jgi:glycine reductase
VTGDRDVLELAVVTRDRVDPASEGGLDGRNLAMDLVALVQPALREPALADAHVEVVHPGDDVRVANVLDAVAPQVKPDDPDTTFPGALGRLSLAGRGRTVRLDGVSVLVACDLRAAGYAEASDLPDAFVAMAGPGADVSPFGADTNVVLTITPAPDVPAAELDRSIRRATLAVSRGIALSASGAADAEVTSIGPRGGEGSPSVCVILQVASEGPFLDTFLYGMPLQGLVPTMLDPREVLDGALASGQYDWASTRNPTAFYQRNALIHELLRSEGEGLRFAGVVLALGYLDSAFEKQRSAMLSARLARMLGADAAICTTFQSGNSHTDTMLTVRACEELDIATTAIVAETNGGLTDHVPEADCIVSVGNEDELVPAWMPRRIVGATLARAGEPVPTTVYLGATSQMGDARLTAVPA